MGSPRGGGKFTTLGVTKPSPPLPSSLGLLLWRFYPSPALLSALTFPSSSFSLDVLFPLPISFIYIHTIFCVYEDGALYVTTVMKSKTTTCEKKDFKEYNQGHVVGEKKNISYERYDNTNSLVTFGMNSGQLWPRQNWQSKIYLVQEWQTCSFGKGCHSVRTCSLCSVVQERLWGVLQLLAQIGGR